jgi:hypothetical protein
MIRIVWRGFIAYRTLAALRTCGLHFRDDLVHRQRGDAGCRHPIGDPEQRVASQLAANRLGEELVESLRSKQACLAGSFESCVRKLDLNRRHERTIRSPKVLEQARFARFPQGFTSPVREARVESRQTAAGFLERRRGRAAGSALVWEACTFSSQPAWRLTADEGMDSASATRMTEFQPNVHH